MAEHKVTLTDQLEAWGDSKAPLLKKRAEGKKPPYEWVNNREIPSLGMSIEKALRKSSGKKDIYFDDTELVLVDKTIFFVKPDSTSKDLMDAVKKLKLL